MTIADSESVSLDVHLPGKGIVLSAVAVVSAAASLNSPLFPLFPPSAAPFPSVTTREKKESLINENRLIGCVPISPVIYPTAALLRGHANGSSAGLVNYNCAA